jgi:transcriptional regulator with XRE-family HTH domain
MHLLHSPAQIARDIGKNAQALRLSKNLSRKTLAQLSGVSESSIKRFELTGSITLESMILLASALDELSPLSRLFTLTQFDSYAQLKNVNRQRGTK